VPIATNSPRTALSQLKQAVAYIMFYLSAFTLICFWKSACQALKKAKADNVSHKGAQTSISPPWNCSYCSKSCKLAVITYKTDLCTSVNNNVAAYNISNPRQNSKLPKQSHGARCTVAATIEHAVSCGHRLLRDPLPKFSLWAVLYVSIITLQAQRRHPFACSANLVCFHSLI
jgi:hypothetical protein